MFPRAMCVLALAALATAATASTAHAAPCVTRAQLDGLVTEASADYLEDAVKHAEQHCQAVLIVIDTPGGMLSSTRRIAQLFLDARVPVITFVAPGGARAGSAGMFLVIAGHIAAMAPGTNIGASHPVVAGGQDPEEAGGKHMGQKIENDTAAFARALAERRARNAGWAERAVRQSVSATALEAERADVIDLVAATDRELLAQIDGRSVSVGGRTVTLDTERATLASIDMTVSQRVRSLLSNPNLAYLLLIVGMLLLLMELYSPGMIVPGVAGGVAILLAVIGLDALPVQVGAVVLLAVALAMFVAEIYVVSYGLLALGGLALLLLGSALLIDRSAPGFFADASVRVSWGVIIPLGLLVAGAAAGLAWYAAHTRWRVSPTGAEGLVGERGHVASVRAGRGKVWVHGELWDATFDEPVPTGAPVRVTGVNGLRLRAAPVSNGKEKRDE